MFVAFLKTLGLSLGAAWVLLLVGCYLFWPTLLGRELLIGCLLPTLSFVLGFYAVSKTVYSSWKRFAMAVFGGMLIRLAVIGTICLLIVLLTSMQMSPLLLSLVGFYTLCLTVELYFVHSRLPNQEGTLG